MADKAQWKKAVRQITWPNGALRIETTTEAGKEIVGVQVLDTSLAGNPKLVAQGSLSRVEIEGEDA